MQKQLLSVSILFLAIASVVAQTKTPMNTRGSLPSGYWPVEKRQPIIDKPQTIRLAPDVSHLSAGERSAVAKLLEVGKIFQQLYEDQKHHQALTSYAALLKLQQANASATETVNLVTLYRLFQGPIATTLENKREPFLPVDPTTPAKNVYPWDVTREELEAFLAAHTEQRNEFLHPRNVVRRES